MYDVGGVSKPTRGRKELGNRVLVITSIIANIVFVLMFLGGVFSRPVETVIEKQNTVYVRDTSAEKIVRVHDTLFRDVIVSDNDSTVSYSYDLIDFVYLKIPTNKLIEYSEIAKKVVKNKKGGYEFSSPSNQRRWQWLRETLKHDLEPYTKNGIAYTWVLTWMNSNTFCVSNTGEFKMNKKLHLKEFTKYRNKIKK